MLPFELGTTKFELPQDYGELTMKQFFDLRKSPGDLITVLSILSGIDKDQWEQCKDLDLDYKLAPYLEFLYKPFDPAAYILPDKLKIEGVYYDRPKTLTVETWGQKLAFSKEYERIQKEGLGEFDIYPFSLALYFQPIVYRKEGQDKKYNGDQVEELLPKIMNCSLEEAFPIAAFFLTSYYKSRKRKQSDYLIPLAKKKYEQALIGSQNTDRLERFTMWRRALIKISRRFFKWNTGLSTRHYGTNQINTLTKKG